jgi:hypothetical protein
VATPRENDANQRYHQEVHILYFEIEVNKSGRSESGGAGETGGVSGLAKLYEV